MLNPVFINNVVLCRKVEYSAKENKCDLYGVFHSFTLEDNPVPDWKIDVECQMCVTAVVADPTIVHKIDLGIKAPDGSEKMLGDFTLSIPIRGISLTQVPLELTLNQEGTYYLFFFLGNETLRSFALGVGSDTILMD